MGRQFRKRSLPNPNHHWCPHCRQNTANYFSGGKKLCASCGGEKRTTFVPPPAKEKKGWWF